MDSAGYNSKAEDTAPFEEKQSHGSSISSESIRSQDRVQDAENGIKKETEAQDVPDEVAAVDAAGTGGQNLTLKKSRSVTNAASIPNGGMWAWLQVLGGFFLLFNSWYVLTHSFPHLSASTDSKMLTI